MKYKFLFTIVISILTSFSQLVFSQGKPTAAEIAAKLANPTTAPMGMNHNFDFRRYQGDLPGASDQAGFTYLFQPVIPLSASLPRFTFRPAVPILVNQPVYNGENGDFDSNFELGDIGFDFLYGTTYKSGFLLSGGVVGSLPTGTGEIASKQWQLGPNALFGIAKKWGVIGALVGHKWGIAGPGTKANQTITSLFLVFPFGDGTWQILSLPVATANHNLEGEIWSIPINAGIGKTLSLGDNMFRVNINYSYYVVSPDAFGPKSNFRLTISKIINLNYKK